MTLTQTKMAAAASLVPPTVQKWGHNLGEHHILFHISILSVEIFACAENGTYVYCLLAPVVVLMSHEFILVNFQCSEL